MTDALETIRDQRLEKADKLRELGRNPFGNGYAPSHLAAQIHAEWGSKTKEELEGNRVSVKISGRVVASRLFGKAGFFKLQDRSGKIQVYCQKQHLSEEDFQVFKLIDIGDILYIEGPLFRTKTDELSVQADSVQIATKSLRPLPEKWHGLTDVETRYRQRYVDLIANPKVRDDFIKRAQIVEGIRQFFVSREFLEVETPMMHSIPGGAMARPFVTHHNTLDIDLYLRIAPELHLKRLVVGGLERVFEINRNFRNEGISTQHNPEFTMIEWYQAYATYEDLMAMIEQCISKVCQDVFGTSTLTYQGQEINFTGPYRRYKMVDALRELAGVPEEVIQDRVAALQFAQEKGIKIRPKGAPMGTIMTELFENLVEPHLIEPTFITHYPVEVSPLARRSTDDPALTDRFELMIFGREIANGFSELNDPIDQAERFRAQAEAKAQGDDEAMYYDEDFVRALEHGMPPTAGAGLGVDRLVMLMTDAASIRDVILFPQLRPEA